MHPIKTCYLKRLVPPAVLLTVLFLSPHLTVAVNAIARISTENLPLLGEILSPSLTGIGLLSGLGIKVRDIKQKQRIQQVKEIMKTLNKATDSLVPPELSRRLSFISTESIISRDSTSP